MCLTRIKLSCNGGNQMTFREQQEIMLAGLPYNDGTPEINKKREQTYLLNKEFNDSYGQPVAKRLGLLRRFLKSVGENVVFETNFRCEFGCNITIGNNFFANFDCIMFDGGEITIGDNVMFGPRVGIYTSNHAVGPRERAGLWCVAKGVRIGDNVWCGANVTINPGVEIGVNTIIGSGSVVTRNVPSGVIAAGNPCRVIRVLTEEELLR